MKKYCYVPKMCKITHFWHFLFSGYTIAFGRLAQKNLFFCKKLSKNGLEKSSKKSSKTLKIQKIICIFANLNIQKIMNKAFLYQLQTSLSTKVNRYGYILLYLKIKNLTYFHTYITCE